MIAATQLPENKKRRYRLHAEIKKTFKMDVKARTVFVPVQQLDNPAVMTDKTKERLGELIGFGYNCQLVFEE